MEVFQVRDVRADLLLDTRDSRDEAQRRGDGPVQLLGDQVESGRRRKPAAGDGECFCVTTSDGENVRLTANIH